MNNREEKRGEGEPQTKEEEKKSGEIGGFTTPTYPPKPHFNLLYCLFKRVFLIPLTQTNNLNLTLITT